MEKPDILEAVIYASDLPAAEAFYTRLLGVAPHAKLDGRHIFYKLSHGMLLIFDPAVTRTPPDGPLPVPPHGAEGQGHVCFAARGADEIQAWRQRLSAMDVAIESDFEWPQGGRSIYFRDPAGNSIEIAEPRIWGF
ncbi:MAG TPA: VOC family protein [Hyphomicrobium sp.]|nr:VOC family protein [Hyphomicrobium sp.]HRO49855.1 VOC family protein [Hyphomicrobium sp.]